jgi:hypothetical protein
MRVPLRVRLPILNERTINPDAIAAPRTVIPTAVNEVVNVTTTEMYIGAASVPKASRNGQLLAIKSRNRPSPGWKMTYG